MGTFLDGIMTAPLIDSSGERLWIEGVDLTDFYNGTAVINWEHAPASSGSENIIGQVVYCKKIMKKEDCETKRQRYFYDIAKGPYVYIIGELYDDEGHAGALACAAMVRYYTKRKAKMFIGWSIEGATFERDGNDLKRAVARKVAFTLKPCLKVAVMGAPNDDEVKEVMGKTEKSEDQLMTVQASDIIIDSSELPVGSPIQELQKALHDLQKTLTVDSGDVAPSQLVGGAALVPEHIVNTMKNRVKAALRDWNRRKSLKETIKAALPEVSDEYVDHFTRLADDLMIKKSNHDFIRLGKQNLQLDLGSDSQDLIEGFKFIPKTDDKIQIGRNDAGQEVSCHRGLPQEQALAAIAYHKIAGDLMGLRHMVPHAAIANTGQPHDIAYFVQHVPGRSPYESHQAWAGAIGKAIENQDAIKGCIADHVLGCQRGFNQVLANDKGLTFIDNHSAFQYDAPANGGDIYTEAKNYPVSPDTSTWAKSLPTKEIAKTLYMLGMGPEKVQQAVLKLRSFQKLLQPGFTIQSVLDTVMPPKKDIHE